MTTVELVYDGDCPTVAHARGHLFKAFAVARVTARWMEWNRSDPSSPPHVRRYGSPTILVDGHDVAGVSPGEGVNSCRLYQGPCGELLGVPSVEEIARALLRPSASREDDWRDVALPLCGTPGRGAHGARHRVRRARNRQARPIHSERNIPVATKRTIEVFSAGCPACEETIELVNRTACSSCEVSVLDMKDADVARRGKSLGIRSVPAVAINGKLTDCCANCGPDEATLRAAGLGQPVP